MKPKFDTNRIERKVLSRSKVCDAWEARQRRVRYGSAGEYIGGKTDLAIAGDYVVLFRKPRTSVADFEREARAIGLLK
jgi:hypothetical protein